MMNFAEAICERLNGLDEGYCVVINDRTTFDLTPNGYVTNEQAEECEVLAATPSAGLHLLRVKDQAEISFQWHAVGSLRIVQ